MSFDPFGQHPESPLRPLVPGGASTPPGGGPIHPDVAAAMNRVKLPGLFLVAVGSLNLVAGLLLAFMTLQTSLIPDKTIAEQYHKGVEVTGKMFGGLATPEEMKRMKEQAENKTPENLKRELLAQYGGMTAVAVMVGLLVVLGGVRMLQLRSYGLCIFASLTAAIPCISVSSCCGMGEIVALWSIIVLLSPEVRLAFR